MSFDTNPRPTPGTLRDAGVTSSPTCGKVSTKICLLCLEIHFFPPNVALPLWHYGEHSWGKHTPGPPCLFAGPDVVCSEDCMVSICIIWPRGWVCQASQCRNNKHTHAHFFFFSFINPLALWCNGALWLLSASETEGWITYKHNTSLTEINVSCSHTTSFAQRPILIWLPIYPASLHETNNCTEQCNTYKPRWQQVVKCRDNRVVR